MEKKFANLGTMLSRAQAKKVVGGLALDHCTFSGFCTFPSFQYEEGEGWAANTAQSMADAWCEAQSCCTDVDCPGAA